MDTKAQLELLKEFEGRLDNLLKYDPTDSRAIGAMLLADTARIMATPETRDAIERILEKCHALGIGVTRPDPPARPNEDTRP